MGSHLMRRMASWLSPIVAASVLSQSLWSTVAFATPPADPKRPKTSAKTKSTTTKKPTTTTRSTTTKSASTKAGTTRTGATGTRTTTSTAGRTPAGSGGRATPAGGTTTTAAAMRSSAFLARIAAMPAISLRAPATGGRASISGLGDLVPLATIRQRIEQAVSKGERPAGDRIPPDDSPDAASYRLPTEAHNVYKEILPGFVRYIDYVWDRVINRQARAPQRADGESDADLAVDLFFNQGCRLIARRLPGYARVIKREVASSIDTSGPWEEPISPEALRSELGAKPSSRSGGTSAATAPKYDPPPPKKEVVEVCFVTHLQLEETLKEDVRRITRNKRWQQAKGDPGEVKRVAEVPNDERALIAILARHGGALKLEDGQPLDAPRFLDSNEVCRRHGGRSVQDDAVRFGKSGSAGAPAPAGKPGTKPASKPGSKPATKSAPRPTSKTTPKPGRRSERSRHDEVAACTPAPPPKKPAGKPVAKSNTAAKKAPAKTSAKTAPGKPGTRAPVKAAAGKASAKTPIAVSSGIIARAVIGDPVGSSRASIQSLENLVCEKSEKSKQPKSPPWRPYCGVPEKNIFVLLIKAMVAKASGGLVDAAVRCRPNWDWECNQKFGRLGLKFAAKLEGGRVACRPTPEDRARKAAEFMLTADLGATKKELAGETLGLVARRLEGFYQKGARARNFARVRTQHQDKIGLPAGDIPEGARETMRHQNNPKVIAVRTEREELRRMVDQWTDAFEYEEMTGALSRYGLLDRYKAAEGLTSKRFWTSCDELRAICEDPKFPQERKACIECAVRATQEYCVEGKSKSSCKGSTKASFPEKLTVQGDPKAVPQRVIGTTELEGGNTFFNWLIVQVVADAYNPTFHRGNSATDPAKLEAGVAQNIAVTKFLGVSAGEDKIITNDGQKFLDALPVSAWQRCYLWNPFQDAHKDICDKQDVKSREAQQKLEGLKRLAGAGIPWEKSPLFKAVLGHPRVKDHLRTVSGQWKEACKAKQVTVVHSFLGLFETGREVRTEQLDCAKEGRIGNDAVAARFQQGVEQAAQDLGLQRETATQDVGGDVMTALAPVIGKLLGLLLNAAGLTDMMKTLAKAAGMTPEQSADCEDPEYRKDVMKLPENQSTKRDCLSRVFAKNFVNVLESIIVMLGDKLVDWGVDLLRMALQAVKSAALAAAGSVPFAGGFLATLVDILWELLMNFGMKMLLKTFVIAQLPTWLKIKELSSKQIEKVIEENPIVRVVAGMIMELLDMATKYGNKSWIAVGAASVMSVVQLALQNLRDSPEKNFWIRALVYAKREMARQAPDQSGERPFTEVLKEEGLALLRGMVGGFAAVVGRNIPAQQKDVFDQAISSIQGKLSSSGIDQLIADFGRDPVRALVNLIAKDIGPAVIPIVSSLVPMDPWVKDTLTTFSQELKGTLDEHDAGQLTGPKLVGHIAKVIRPLGRHLLEQIPYGDDALRTMVLRAFDGNVGSGAPPTGIIGLLVDIDRVRTQYLDEPWNIVGGAIDVAGDFVRAKVTALLADLPHEKGLAERGIDKLFELLRSAERRNEIFRGGSVNAPALLRMIVEVVKPYLLERLGELGRTLGLETVIRSAVDGLLGPDGPFLNASFDVARWLETRGQAALGDVLTAVSGLLEAQAQGRGPALGGIVRGVLGAIRQGLSGTGGIAALARQGANGILRMAKEALMPIVESILPAPAAGASEPPETALLRSLAGGLGDVFANAQGLLDNPAAALGGVATRVGGALRDAVKGLAQQAVPATESGIRALVGKAIDKFFALLSDPAQLTRLSGAQVIDAVKDGFAELIPVIKEKINAAIPEPARATVGKIVDLVKTLAADPGQLRTLVEGGVVALVSRVASELKTQLLDLLGRAIPEAARAPLREVGDAIAAIIADPTRFQALATATVQGLLADFAPRIKSMLQALLTSVVPADRVAQVNDALEKIRAALANPAGLAAAAGQEAARAIDEVLAQLLVRIEDPNLRELASGLVSFVRDLTQGTPVGTALRSEAKALLTRAATIASRFATSALTSLIPAGPAREVVAQAIEGLKDLLADPAGVATALARRAAEALPGIVRTLAGFAVSALRQAIPDAGLAGLLGGLLQQGLEIIADPARWRELVERGLGVAFTRLLPVVRDFLVSMVGRIPGVSDTARRLVTSFAEVASTFFTNPAALTDFVRNAIPSLISMVVRTAGPVLTDLLDRATGNPAASAFVRRILDGAAEMIGDPSKLRTFLASTAAQALTQLKTAAVSLLNDLIGSFLRDPDLQRIAREGLRLVVEFVEGALSGTGGNAAEAVKRALAAMIPVIADVVRGKLLALFPGSMRAVREVAGQVFDALKTLGVDLVNRGGAAWTAFTSSADGGLLGRLARWVLPLVKTPIAQAIAFAPLRDLVTRLLDNLVGLLDDPAALARTPLQRIMGKLHDTLKPFLDEVLVRNSGAPGTMGRNIVEKLVNKAMGFLRDPSTFQAFVDRVRTGDFRGLARDLVAEILPAMTGAIPSPAVREILTQGVNFLTTNLFGASAPARP
jgi:hypothetical protein